MPSPTLDLSTPEKLAQLMLSTIGLTNMVLGALFLLPLPGYAGWNILINNVSYNTARKLQEKAMIISIVGMIVIIFGFLNTFFNIFMKLFLIISGY